MLLNCRESRYLLLLTENYAALNIIQQGLGRIDVKNPTVIFGSTFPGDLQYAQVNIHKRKYLAFRMDGLMAYFFKHYNVIFWPRFTHEVSGHYDWAFLLFIMSLAIPSHIHPVSLSSIS